ncbi:MAG: RagB/SusD family nutrient uptake outer membrane protein [Rikenellaceae bacterium]|jgi:hypothetical protein|nr:RagB/SusD family nutrient uptake outer membrane protein [Rikenellaceae bacterium]
MKRYLIITVAALLSMSISSCTDLDVAPDGKIFTEEQKNAVVEKDPSKLAADITGMYAVMGLSYYPFERDEALGYTTYAFSMDANGPDAPTTNVFDWFEVCASYEDRVISYVNPRMRWNIFWTQCKQANDIIVALGESPDTDLGKYYKGMAHAVRAFDHLSLVVCYQFTYKGNEDKPGIPIMDIEAASGFDANVGLPRQPLSDVFQFIMDDLNTAVSLLEGYTRSAKSHIDKAVALGLRARTNLIMNNWDAAAADAKAALAAGSYTSLAFAEITGPGFVSANDHNWMWAILDSPDTHVAGWISWESHMSSFCGNSYGAWSGNYRMINRLLWNKIPSSDVRKGWWVDDDLYSPLIEGRSWYGESETGVDMAEATYQDIKEPFVPLTNVKFSAYQNILGNPDVGADWCLMRAEEMLLIQAEAEAMGTAGVAIAKTTLEGFVKTNRDPSYAVTAVDPAAFQLEVWKQRRIELWGEGFSMFDIMRLKKPVVRFHDVVSEDDSNYDPLYQFNIAADDGYLLLRFPQAETNANKGLVNNTGGSMPLSGKNPSLRDGVTD